eukprot:scaffold20528_cov50-Skeletonema_dohrnii-CCMP3373.AAC.1
MELAPNSLWSSYRRGMRGHGGRPAISTFHRSKTRPGTLRIWTPLTPSFTKLCLPTSELQYSLRTDLLARLTIDLALSVIIKVGVTQVLFSLCPPPPSNFARSVDAGVGICGTLKLLDVPLTL